MMQSKTVDKTIDALHKMFTMNGLSENIISDNGSQFTNKAFARFLSWNGITRSVPYHLSRSTIHATIGVTPSLLFLQRGIRTRFDLLQPDPVAHVGNKLSQQRSDHEDSTWEAAQLVPGAEIHIPAHQSVKQSVIPKTTPQSDTPPTERIESRRYPSR